ncbi:LGFP repeat-containing protein [Mycolicibacterium parafortuitum]|uniref:LGFP repeat-containing protein n=1 Tax=Mycolicibacterium parafortuitum TaxID=39692 RepID=A0A375YK37_MYCPF|nr:hypothetical protein [Mycolicibacterium parafortuitum]ORB25258.1 hypothetical protein BST38_27895 [Mycolicibacterium parafortuitum]SRX81517.1 hypothetical protein MPP7335_03269 [Mycolicibacterium parafortuitum]
MIRQPKLRLRVVGRLTVGLLGVATALLLAPAAVAQPEVDANNSITAAWEASGGDTGPLGPRNGDVYPAGEGFAQNFAGGKMFFTPATGAHFMQGAILDKYESLGGPADGDLGFPKIDEGPGRAPDSRNSTFSAPDNPVIFWTPATGARVVRGAINAAWDKLGGSAGALGVPAEDETYNGAVVTQKFTNGEISYDSRAKTFTTVPPELAGQLGDLTIPDDPIAAINAARRAAGGPLGPLGAAEGEPYEIGDDGMGQDFANGAIFYSPDTGANVVTGQVLAKYESVGGPEGDLGFPVTGEEDGGLAPSSRKSEFAAPDKPVIFWTPDHGAFIVRGPMNAAWEKLGGATGELGAPVADQDESGNVISQRFSGGVISWDTSSRKFSTEPAALASQLSDLEVSGAETPAAALPSPQASENSENAGSKWKRWWLLAIVPLVLLAGLVGLALSHKRSRPGDDDTSGGPGRDDEPAPAGDTARGGGDGSEDALFGDRYAREGLGSLSAASSSSASLPAEDFTPEPLSFWGTPARSEAESADGDGLEQDDIEQGGVQPYEGAEDPDADPDAVDTAPTRVLTAPDVPGVSGDGEFSDAEFSDGEFSGDAEFSDDAVYAEEVSYIDVETFEDAPSEQGAPFADADADIGTDIDADADREPIVAPRNAVTDTGRHARIDIDEPTPLGTALHMPFDDPNEVPEGYPVKADTKTGLFWTPDSADYDEAPVELWFATEEIAITNGFVRGE